MTQTNVRLRATQWTFPPPHPSRDRSRLTLPSGKGEGPGVAVLPAALGVAGRPLRGGNRYRLVWLFLDSLALFAHEQLTRDELETELGDDDPRHPGRASQRRLRHQGRIADSQGRRGIRP